MSVPELKGVKMLVSDDALGVDWVERYVIGRLPSGYLLTASDEAFKTNHSWQQWTRCKPLPRPWEVAPEGCRLVTEEEKEKYDKPALVMLYTDNGWDTYGSYGALKMYKSSNYAVPLDYVFEEEVIEVTMAELEAKYGKKVKVVK